MTSSELTQSHANTQSTSLVTYEVVLFLLHLKLSQHAKDIKRLALPLPVSNSHSPIQSNCLVTRHMDIMRIQSNATLPICHTPHHQQLSLFHLHSRCAHYWPYWHSHTASENALLDHPVQSHSMNPTHANLTTQIVHFHID